MTPLAITVAIPTYRRGPILLDTVRHLIALGPAEILVLDQTERHEAGIAAQLADWHGQGAIRWMRLPLPSIPAAMNAGLVAATQPLVVFVDDDVVPEPGLLAAHEAAQRTHPGALVAGRVIQPWDEHRDTSGEGAFAGTHAGGVDEFIGCNFSVPRAAAIALGGFDENFVRVAYRFEAEFSHRWRASGGAIRFVPGACLHHLKAGAGGTRSFGEHLTTWRPDHAVGAYYFGLRTRAWREFVARPVRSVRTRFHLRHPWRIPGTLLAELGGMLWALRLYLHGPRRIVRKPPTP
jgi:GT2 family glycosyltransferase